MLIFKISKWEEGLDLKMRKKKIVVALLCALTIGGSITANAHGGRTDGSGGHKDNQNKSGLGSYHYHCGGNPPHLHNNGCPYKAVATPPQSSTGNGTNSSSSNNSANKSNGSTNNNNQAQIEAQKKAEEQRKLEEQKRVEAEKKAQEERIKKEKEETNKKGYEEGLKDGYDKKENLGENYNGNYKEEYVEGYNRGHAEGAKKIENEIKLASEEGYNDGIKGSESKEGNENKLIEESYTEGYKKGIDEYITKSIEEYKLKGAEDASGRREVEAFDNTVDEKFKEVYLAAYKEKKDELNEKEKEDNIAMAVGLGAIVTIGGGTVLYKKKKGKKSIKF